MNAVQQAYETMRVWDFAVVERYLMEKEGLHPEKIAEMKEEYIRFISLVVGEKTAAPVSYEVDPFWHVHVLHTQNYVPFSTAVAGTFLHHNPAATEEERLALQSEYDGFLALYRKHYGEPDSSYWGPNDMVCKCCCNGKITQ